MEGNLLYAVSLILFCLYFKSSLELILFILALAFYFNVETFIPNPSEGPKAKGLRERTLPGYADVLFWSHSFKPLAPNFFNRICFFSC